MELFVFTIVKLTIGLIVLLVSLRLLGKKSLAQATPLDFVLAVIISNLVANLSVTPDYNMLHVVGVLVFWAVLLFLLDVIKWKSREAKELIQGKPLVIIQNGEVVRETLERERMTVDELAAQLRQQSVFRFADVELALIEINGNISVYEKRGGDLDDC